MPGPFPPDSSPSRVGFGADLASAARALLSQPSVPLVSLALMLLVCGDSRSGHDSDVRSVVGIASMFFLAGWYGVERVFFQRHLQGRPVPLPHLLRLLNYIVPVGGAVLHFILTSVLLLISLLAKGAIEASSASSMRTTLNHNRRYRTGFPGRHKALAKKSSPGGANSRKRRCSR